MLHGAAALLRWKNFVFDENPDGIVASFRANLYDTELIFDPFRGGSLAHYFFRAHEHAGQPYTGETAHRLIEETQLFLEACHACYGRMLAAA